MEHQSRDAVIDWPNDTDCKSSMLLPMIELPTIDLKSERDQLIGFMVHPFRRQADFKATRDRMARLVDQMGTRSVMDCLAVIKG